MNSNTIQITLSFKEDGSIAIIDQTKGKVQDLSKSVETSKDPIKALGDSWHETAGKLLAFGAAAYGVYRTFNSFISEAADAEDITKRLAFSIDRAGYSWDVWGSSIDQWSESTAKLTHTADELVSRGLTQMLQYTTNLTEAQKGVQLALNISRKTGENYDTTLRMVGMTMAGFPEIAGRWIPQLRTINATLGENASLDQKAAAGMKELMKAFGETQQLGTYKEKISDFSSSWVSLKKSIGEEALPPLKDFLDTMTEVVEKMKEHRDLSKETPFVGKSFLGLFGFAPGGARRPLQEQLAGMGSTKAGWVVEEGLPEPGKAEIKDPFTRMFGMTQSEFDDRMAYSKLKYQEWLEGRIAQGQQFEQEQKMMMDRIMAGYTGAEFTYPTEDLLPDLIAIESETGEIVTVSKDYLNILKEEKLNAAELLATTRQLSGVRSGAEFTYPTTDILPDWISTKKGPMLVDQWKSQMMETQTVTENAFKGIANIWSSSFSQMRRSGESFSDWFKGMWLDMADYAVGQITKIAMNYTLWGNLTGEKGGTSFFGKSSGGYGGILGGLLGLLKLQEGGEFWVNRPTPLLVGEGGQREFVKVTPESKMGQAGGDTYIVNNYNQVYDPNNYARLYGGVIRKISIDSVLEARRLNQKI